MKKSVFLHSHGQFLQAWSHICTYIHRGTEPNYKIVCYTSTYTYVTKVCSRPVPNGYIAIILWDEEFQIHT